MTHRLWTLSRQRWGWRQLQGWRQRALIVRATHSVRESQTRRGTIRSTPRQSANFCLIHNLRNPTLTKRLLELWEAGSKGQEELLWALRCLRLHYSGVRQPLPPQLRREAGCESDGGEVQELIVIDGDDDMDDVIDVETYLVECLITKVVKPDPSSDPSGGRAMKQELDTESDGPH